MSIIEPTRERGLLRLFPGRTETDLYLWVSEYRLELQNDLGWSIRPEDAVTELASKENRASHLSDIGSWRTAKMFDRYIDKLFGEILVPITGTPESWQALEQAIIIAQKEQSDLNGLHLVSSEKYLDSDNAREIRARFHQRCEEANLTANLAVEKGSVSKRVPERALLTDLVVMNVAHPPLPGLSSLRSGLRSIIWRCARPILTVPGKVSPLDRVLLAFDGSAKSKEALFVATYLAEKWKVELVVVTLKSGASASAQDYARSYLELHEIQAKFIEKKGSFETFTRIIKDYRINLVVMGGYSGSVISEIISGSAVNFLLRQARCPLLICR